MENNKRDPILDIAKGIGIILVVVGHSLEMRSSIGRFIWSFHMPLFFIISGLCFNEIHHNNIRAFVVSRFKSLVFPAAIFTAFCILVAYGLRLDNAREMLCDLSYRGLPGALWFLLVLFITEIEYSGCLYLVRLFNRNNINVVMMLMATIAYLIGCYSSKLHLVGPYSLFTVFSAYTFYTLGHLMRPCFARINDLSHCLLWTISGGVVILLFNRYAHSPLNMAQNDIAVTDIFPAVIGTFAIFALSKLIIEKLPSNQLPPPPIRILCWLGKNTLSIMAVHMLLITISTTYIMPLVSSHIIYKGMEQIFVWSACIIITTFVTKKAKWMLGKF